jgi:RHS repeat-associated protein
VIVYRKVAGAINGSRYTTNNLLKFKNGIEVSQTGYLYIWVSNESENTEVWFDDVNVIHQKTLVAEATDYGVWGGIMREQKYDPDQFYRYGYQGKYAEKDEETGWNHFQLREYDDLIGRWMVRDPHRQYPSPYTGMGNNPSALVDVAREQ